MTPEKIKEMVDACYLAKRIRDLLPQLPEGVAPSYLHVLDTVHRLHAGGSPVKVSDISAALGLPRPGVTRLVKQMEAGGFLQKVSAPEDGRITYVTVTEKGKALSDKFDRQFYNQLAEHMDGIPESEADTMIRTISRFYQIMSERKMHFEFREK